tara:strand:- start:26 stop:340 length:315 start_codon:yes stop_codon:yes gene_type:complete
MIGASFVGNPDSSLHMGIITAHGAGPQILNAVAERMQMPKYDPVLDFRNKVVDMRRKQVAFFESRSKDSLLAAVAAEQAVDKIIGLTKEMGKNEEKRQAETPDA